MSLSSASLALLGASLARRGPLAVVAIAISVLTALGACVLALSLEPRDGMGAWRSVPLLASSAIAWGGGFLHAVAASMHTLRRDRQEGIVQLFTTRTTSLRGYVIARVAGLAVFLGGTVFLGTLLVSIVSILAAPRLHDVAMALSSSVGPLLYAVAFGVVIAPIAFATLGARSRGRGYLVLLLVLVVPEYLSQRLASVLPEELTEVLAIPSALAALRSSLLPGSLDLVRLLRALVALAIIAGVAMFFVGRDVSRLESEDA
jgi:hypothetical protein